MLELSETQFHYLENWGKRPASQLFPEDQMTWCNVQKAYVYGRGQ